MEPEMDLRRLRYFIAVAERLHFGHAAAALHITQPSLSRQIQQLERDLGVDLFARTSREVTLTSGGEQLLRDGRRLLEMVRETRERVRFATGGPTLTVGFMLGIDVDSTRRVFRERRPEVGVRLQRIRWWNQRESLLDGRVDIGFVRLPVNTEGLVLLPLYAEPLTVALPAGHSLSGHPSVTVADLAAEPVLHYADATASWTAFWSIDPRPDGTQPRYGPVVRDMEEIVAYVREGSGIAFLPEAIAAVFARPEIVYVPVADAPPGQIALAWDAEHTSSLVTAFAEAARRTYAAKA